MFYADLVQGTAGKDSSAEQLTPSFPPHYQLYQLVYDLELIVYDVLSKLLVWVRCKDPSRVCIL